MFTADFRGGAFLTSARTRSMTSFARSTSLTMRTSAWRASSISGGSAASQRKLTPALSLAAAIGCLTSWAIDAVISPRSITRLSRSTLAWACWRASCAFLRSVISLFVLVVVAPISSITARRVVSGRPRQFCVMWQNSRCSIPAFAGTSLVPLRRAWRIVVDVDHEPGLIGQLLQFELPEPHPRAVGAAAVRRNRQLSCIRIALLSHALAPATNGLHGKLGRVARDPDADEAGVGGHIVHAIGDDLAELFILEVVHVHALRVALGTTSEIEVWSSSEGKALLSALTSPTCGRR